MFVVVSSHSFVVCNASVLLLHLLVSPLALLLVR